jgi:hypothetical protein
MIKKRKFVLKRGKIRRNPSDLVYRHVGRRECKKLMPFNNREDRYFILT